MAARTRTLGPGGTCTRTLVQTLEKATGTALKRSQCIAGAP